MYSLFILTTAPNNKEPHLNATPQLLYRFTDIYIYYAV